MPITYKHDDIPDLWTVDLPSEERQRADELQSALGQMALITDEVASAVALFDFARQRVRYLEELLETNPADRAASPQQQEQESVSGWQRMAARALAGAVWRFEEARQRAGMLADAVPPIAALLDRDALRESDRHFRGHFLDAGAPAAEPAGRHPAATSDDPDRRRLARTPLAPAPPAAELVGTTFTYVRDGRRLQLEVGAPALRTLVRVRDQYFAAFAHVGQTLQERHWQATRWHAEKNSED